MPEATPSERQVILTGSTGSLGAYLLDALLRDAKVGRVLCLNRSIDAPQRQKQNHAARGLSTDFTRVEFITSDLSEPRLGLQDSIYLRIAAQVTHVLHNAWSVDFNRHVTSFEPQIRGVRHLIDFVGRCSNPVILFFMSSVSVGARWGAVPGALAKIPETVLEDWRMAKMGYGQSKLVSERLLSEASRASGITTVICRVGQVAGPIAPGSKGMWNKQEWVPSLIASSKVLGKIPSTLGPIDDVDWTPVDSLAQIVVGLLLLRPHTSHDRASRYEKDATVYHVVNPSCVPWSSLLPSITRQLGKGVVNVSFVEWVDELKRSMEIEHLQDLTANPALKLLSYFDDLQDKAIRFPRTKTATLSVTQTVRVSKVLASMPKVNPEWMEAWMQQWAF